MASLFNTLGNFAGGAAQGFQAGQQLSLQRKELEEKKKLRADQRAAAIAKVESDKTKQLLKFLEIDPATGKFRNGLDSKSIRNVIGGFMASLGIKVDSPNGKFVTELLSNFDRQSAEQQAAILNVIESAGVGSLTKFVNAPGVTPMDLSTNAMDVVVAQEKDKLKQGAETRQGQAVNLLLPNGKTVIGRIDQRGTVTVNGGPPPQGAKLASREGSGVNINFGDFGGGSTGEGDLGDLGIVGDDAGLATGGSGFFGNMVNKMTDLVGAGLAFPNLAQAKNDLERIQKVSGIILAAPVEGKPTNFVRQQLDDLTVEPAALFQGDEDALIKLTGQRDLARSLVNNSKETLAKFGPALSAERRSALIGNMKSMEGLAGAYTKIVENFRGKLPVSELSDDFLNSEISKMESVADPNSLTEGDHARIIEIIEEWRKRGLDK